MAWEIYLNKVLTESGLVLIHIIMMSCMNLKFLLCGIATVLLTGTVKAVDYTPEQVNAHVSLKVPGNKAKQYPLILKRVQNDNSTYQLVASESIPLTISQKIKETNGRLHIDMCITALEDVYFNYGQNVSTGFRHDDCLFYMPGFWYRRNLRSPKEAPSFHTSDSWVVREDRLSAPLTGIYNEKDKRYMTVNRLDKFTTDALTTHKEGEVILSGKTSLGFTGFENQNGVAALSFGFPYQEAPRSYIRKLTLAPKVEAFQLLKKGENVMLTWEISESSADDFSDFIRQTWEYSYDTNCPQIVNTPYSPEKMKEVMSNFFVESFVGNTPTHYYSGVELRTATCDQTDVAEVGFVGRTLLNAFNALEYGEQQRRTDLVTNAYKIFDSYLQNGFSETGFFNEVVHYRRNFVESVHSIRRQSEGVYALLHFLNYERLQLR